MTSYCVFFAVDLSEIRYHFTPCGATGRLGPTYDDCLRYYSSIDSPIIRDGVLADTYSSRYAGSQTFRPPRVTEWNLTVAGAAGGRGICNTLQGRGLVARIPRVSFRTGNDILVLAGQRGLGPCDVLRPVDLGYSLCQMPPQNLTSAAECNAFYSDWISTFNSTLLGDFSGGAGGGGASFVGTRQYPYLLGEIVAIVGGGGGTSLLVRYKIDSGFDLTTPELYQEFIDAKPVEYDNFTLEFFGRRGYRIAEDFETAGAGGGYSEAFDIRSSSDSDGRALNISEQFAQGGRHCLTRNIDIPEQFRGADGGFGGGGGGCLEGGGGGGFTGGSVIDVTATTPGSGGYLFLNWSGTLLDPNEGEGYVDIVEADCGCVYQCEVFEEDDQFLCLCPNDTQLAPDLSDCFFSKYIHIMESYFDTVIYDTL